MKTFKLMRRRRGSDLLYPLFIGKSQGLQLGVWYEAQCLPTKGYALRPGWHSGASPAAPWLLRKDGTLAADRVWCECEIEDYYVFRRPSARGGEWYISKRLCITKILED